MKDDDLEDVYIKADAVIKSIGYKTMPISGVPFDSKKHTIPHNHGCVLKDGTPQIGLYVAGWAKRGPVGIIDATLRDTRETFGMIKHHIENGQLPEMKTTIADIQSILPKSYVSYESWIKIDSAEIERGQPSVKVREKILHRDEMLKIS